MLYLIDFLDIIYIRLDEEAHVAIKINDSCVDYRTFSSPVTKTIQGKSEILEP